MTYRFYKLIFKGVALFHFAHCKLVLFALDLFDIYENGDVTSYIRVGQCVIVCILTVLILLGIENVAKEVGLPKLGGRAKLMAYASFFVYLLWLLACEPHVTAFLGKGAFILYPVSIVALFLLVAINLILIYSCYMRICMPEEKKRK